MSAHDGVSCDACGKSNFRSKRYKCLICYDYDLCSTCYEQGETSSNHTTDHPMQCILTRQDFDLYYHGERYTSDQAQSYTCPFCGEKGFSLPFLSESSTNHVDLFYHLQSKHSDEQQSNEVICPICAAMAHGEPNLVTSDLLSHIANEHQHQVQTPSTPSITPSLYSRQSSSSSNREFDLTSNGIGRATFRRGLLRAPGRRGVLGGRGGGNVSQHFVLDNSSTNGSSDPIADLLSQLSTVRRLAAVNNSSSSSSNSTNVQSFSRPHYDRDRLRTTGRTHHSQHITPTSSSILSSLENEIFDSLFSPPLLIDSSSSNNNNNNNNNNNSSNGNITNNNNQQTWAQIVAQQQPPSEQQRSVSSSTIATEPNSSLLRKLCEDTSGITQPNNKIEQKCKRRSDFTQSLLLASFVCPFNDNDK